MDGLRRRVNKTSKEVKDRLSQCQDSANTLTIHMAGPSFHWLDRRLHNNDFCRSPQKCVKRPRSDYIDEYET